MKYQHWLRYFKVIGFKLDRLKNAEGKQRFLIFVNCFVLFFIPSESSTGAFAALYQITTSTNGSSEVSCYVSALFHWIPCTLLCSSLFFRLGLNNFVGDNFPLKSTEFIKGGPQYNDYIQALDKVLVRHKHDVKLVLRFSAWCRCESDEV